MAERRHALKIMGAIGVHSQTDVRPWHILRRTGLAEHNHYGRIYEFIEEGSLLKSPVPKSFENAFNAAKAESFAQSEGYQWTM